MAAAARTRKRAPTTNSPAKEILAIGNHITTHVVSERHVEMATLLRGATAGKNIHQQGPAGSAKSLMLRTFAKCITGARYFGKAVHAQMPADAILGGYDMPRFAKTGEFARNSEHYLPNAHVGNIDEVTRANGPTLDALLPILNTEERMSEQNGGMVKTPLLFIVTASNFMPDADDAHLGAFVDRITLMQYIGYVRSDESFKQMALNRWARRAMEDAESEDEFKDLAKQFGIPEAPTITLERFREAQAMVRRVRPTHEFLDAYAKLRREAKNEGLMVSDRRWMEGVDVASASAFFADRDELIPEDIVAVEPLLWRDHDQIPLAHKLVLEYHGRFEREAVKYRQEITAPLAIIEQQRPTVESTPPTEQIDMNALTAVLSAARQLKLVKHRVAKVLEEAEAEKRDAAALRDIDNEIKAVFSWMDTNGLTT